MLTQPFIGFPDKRRCMFVFVHSISLLHYIPLRIDFANFSLLQYKMSLKGGMISNTE